jgi:hypothetical protein
MLVPYWRALCRPATSAGATVFREFGGTPCRFWADLPDMDFTRASLSDPPI